MATTTLNIYDRCLRQRVKTLEKFDKTGLLCGDCSHPDDKPWLTMPSDGRWLNQLGSLVLPNDTDVHAVPLNGQTSKFGYKVPVGWDGVINKLTFSFTGEGFVQGSGDLIWSVWINQFIQPTGSANPNGGYPASDYGSVPFQIGGLQGSAPDTQGGGIRIYTNQLVTLCIQRPNAGSDSLGPNTARITVGAVGWIYPVK